DDSWKKVESILKKTAQTPTIDRVAIYIDKDNNLKLNDQPVSQENLLKEINKLNTFLTPEQKRKHVWVSVLYEDEAKKPFAQQIIKELQSIDIYSTSLSNAKTLNKHNLKPFNVLSNEG